MNEFNERLKAALMEGTADVNETNGITTSAAGATSTVIEVVDPQSAKLKETKIQHGSGADRIGEKSATLMERTLKRAGMSLREAATTGTFPVLLRDGLKAILFDSYNQEPFTYDQLTFNEPSSKPEEYWTELNSLGVLPQVDEGNPYPEIDGSVDRAVKVSNLKRGAIFSITEELTRFDRLNMIKQYPRDLGAAARTTIEQSVYSVLTTTGNYTRTATAGDNDIGANTSALTFSATGLITAYATIRTMKDRKSGRYLNIVPDTLVVTPQLEFAAKMLITTPSLMRVGGNIGSNTNEVYGTGQDNPFRGLITKIIVSPFLGTSYQWLLCKAGRGVVLQEVDPLQMLTLGADMGQLSEGYFNYDKIRYRAREWFGVGIMNDRSMAAFSRN